MLRKIGVLISVVAVTSAAQAGLIGHWTFDTNGNDSAGSNNTSLNGGAAVNTGTFILGGGSLGGQGTGGRLDGLDDQAITGSNSGIAGSTARTVSVWFKAPTDPGAPDDAPTMVGLGTSSGTGTRFDSRLSNSTGVITSNYTDYLRLEGQASSRMTTSGTGVTNDLWHNLVVSFSGSTFNDATMYLDGKAITLGANATTVNTTAAPLVVGGSNHTTDTERNFYGFLDDVGLWSNSSTAADAAMLNGLGRIGNNDLSYLGAAQTLWAGNVGDTAMINGVQWQKVTGLTGSLGDYSQVGGANGVDSFMVLNSSGGGLQVIPEPATVGLMGIFGVVALLRKRRMG